MSTCDYCDKSINDNEMILLEDSCGVDVLGICKECKDKSDKKFYEYMCKTRRMRKLEVDSNKHNMALVPGYKSVIEGYLETHPEWDGDYNVFYTELYMLDIPMYIAIHELVLEGKITQCESPYAASDDNDDEW